MSEDDDLSPGETMERDADGLTAFQRRFALNYIQNIGNADATRPKQQAALDAGYGEKNAPTAAWRNLRNPAVVAFIGKHLQATTAKVGIDKSYVLFKAVIAAEMAEARGNLTAMNKALDLIARHVDVRAYLPGEHGGGGGNFAGDLSKLSREQLLALASILATMGGNPLPTDA